MKRSNIPGQGVIGGGEGAISTSQEDKTNISGQDKIISGQIFSAATSFDKLWNTKVLSKWG